jgi:hypothetical protein
MPYLRLRQVQILNEETFLNDNSILLYVQYGFVNNPLAVQSVQLRIGEVAQGSLISSGRLTTI